MYRPPNGICQKSWPPNVRRQKSRLPNGICRKSWLPNVSRQTSLDAKCLGGVWPKREMSQTPMVLGTKYQDAKCLGMDCPSNQLSWPPFVWGEKFLGARCPSAKGPGAKYLGREMSPAPKVQTPIVQNTNCRPGNVRARIGRSADSYYHLLKVPKELDFHGLKGAFSLYPQPSYFIRLE